MRAELTAMYAEALANAQKEMRELRAMNTKLLRANVELNARCTMLIISRNQMLNPVENKK